MDDEGGNAFPMLRQAPGNATSDKTIAGIANPEFGIVQREDHDDVKRRLRGTRSGENRGSLLRSAARKNACTGWSDAG